MISAADPARGSTVFNRCKACHTVEEGGRHRVGSNLWSIVGKDIASAEGYNYTDAMIGVVTLEQLLPSPHHKIIRSCSVQAQMLRVLAAMSRRVRLRLGTAIRRAWRERPLPIPIVASLILKD